MAFIKTTTPTALGGKLIVDTKCDTTSADNVTGATSGIVYIVKIDATGNVVTTSEPGCYVKIVDASSATGGGVSSTVPDLVFYAPHGVVTTYVISGGWAFSSGVCMWCVTTAALNGDIGPTADVKVSLVST